METLGLIVGTLAGFITAFFAEPIKTYFSDRNTRNQMRKSLYREMLHLYISWMNLLEAVESGKLTIEIIPANVETIVLFDVYEYAKKNPVVFYSLDDATTIDSIYRAFQLAKKMVLVNPGSGLKYGSMASGVFENMAKKDEIDYQYIVKVGNPSDVSWFIENVTQSRQ